MWLVFGLDRHSLVFSLGYEAPICSIWLVGNSCRYSLVVGCYIWSLSPSQNTDWKVEQGQFYSWNSIIIANSWINSQLEDKPPANASYISILFEGDFTASGKSLGRSCVGICWKCWKVNRNGTAPFSLMFEAVGIKYRDFIT